MSYIVSAGVFAPTGSGDEAAINAAIDALPSTGGEIVLGCGTFVLEHPIRAYDKTNIRIRALVKGASIVQLSPTFTSTSISGTSITGAVTFAGCSDFEVWGLVIDGQTNAVTMNGIECRPIGADVDGQQCIRGEVASNVVKVATGVHNYAIWILKNQNCRVFNNTVDGGETTFGAYTHQEGIEVVGGDDVSVYANTVSNIGGAGINLGCITPLAHPSTSNIRVWGNNIVDCWYGIAVTSLYGATYGPGHIDDMLIFGNTIAARLNGFILFNTTGNASTPPRISNLRFSGNTITMAGTFTAGVVPISVTNQSATSLGDTLWQNVVIADNVCLDNPGTDVNSVMLYCKAAQNIDFSGNRFKCVAKPCSAVGVFFDGCANLKFNNNYLEGCNIRGMTVSNTASIEVMGNYVVDYALSGASNSALVVTGTCTNVFERNNRFSTTAYATASQPVHFDVGINGVAYGGSEYVGGNWGGDVYTENGGAATNSSRGSVTCSGGADHFTVTTSRCRALTTVVVYQYSGAIVAVTKVVPANGSFSFYIAAANDGAVYKWRILE